jgi:alginate O-acetyltransferase complex protein AlgI
MLFNSPEFIAFFLLTYALYLVLPFRLQNYMLLILSYIFYGWWDCRFLFLVALSTTIDFWVGLMIQNGGLRPREWILPALFLTISAVVFLGLDPVALLKSLDGGHFDLSEFVKVPLI